MLNCDWLLSGEAVDSAEAGEAGDASLGYSSHIWVAGWFQACFQLCRDDDDAHSSSCGVSFCGEACEVLLREVFLGGMGAGSGIQLRRRSMGGRVIYIYIYIYMINAKGTNNEKIILNELN